MSARVLVAVAVAGLALAASERRHAARLRAIQRERDYFTARAREARKTDGRVPA